MTKNKRQASDTQHQQANNEDHNETISKLKPIPIRLLTHNIRYATTSPFKGESPWPTRLPLLLAQLHHSTLHNPESLICLQEVLHAQLLDILNGLNRLSNPNPSSSSSSSSDNEWVSIGVGRDDGETHGEYSPILFRPRVWKLLHHRTVWLSEHPYFPGPPAWDAAAPRIVTIGVLEHVATGAVVGAMSTHLDDQGSRARLEAAKILVQQIRNLRPVPVVLAGDLNSEPGQEAYGVLSAEGSPVEDVRARADGVRRYGHEMTYTGFGYEGEPEKRIDFVFVSRGEQEGWEVERYAVLESRFEDGVFVSDHRAVVGDLVLRPKKLEGRGAR